MPSQDRPNQLINALLILAVPIPSILLWKWSIHHCKQYVPSRNDAFASTWCQKFEASSFVAVNILFLLNVDLLFWVISLVQNSTWLIDPYWTILPPLIIQAYKSHPKSTGNEERMSAIHWLILVWSLRLTHSYFRRENWQLGIREDWRFTDLRQKFGKNWWWMSFFATYLSQHTMLIGLTFPVYIVSLSSQPYSPILDRFAKLVSYTGIFIAWRADSQLHYYTSRRKEMSEQGRKTYPLCQQGLWRVSRHPNYFGEQLFWYGIALFGVNTGNLWAFLGAIYNTACMYVITKMVEERMLKDQSRAEAYRNYMANVSMWIPYRSRS